MIMYSGDEEVDTNEMDDNSPSYEEARAEGYQLAKEMCSEELGREPTEDEIEEQFEALCEDSN